VAKLEAVGGCEDRAIIFNSRITVLAWLSVVDRDLDVGMPRQI
jgi:hypothetical protein